MTLGSAWAQAPGAGPVVVREGSGERRATLDKMELQPFPETAWGTLSDWVGGKAVSANETKGSVVLICTYSDWYDPAKRAWAMARRLGETRGKDGLVIVGAHHQQGWEAAKKDLPKDGKLYIARDAKGEFRRAILSDQDPDFYVIDRAGQLRFADIETESVETAVNILLAESAEDAAAIKGKLAAAAAAADAQFRKSGVNREKVDMSTLPEVPFSDPAKDEYEKVTWPKKPAEPNNYGNQEAAPKTIQLPQGAAAGAYLPKAPQLKGRAVVVYVFSPDVRSTYDRVTPMMDRLQVQHGRDLAVIGAATFVTDRNSYNQPQIDPKEALKKMQDFAASRSLVHSLTLYNDGMIGARDNSSDRDTVPWAVVASSNGVVRWSGRPTDPGFQAALEQVIAADPAVRNRRAAEEAYIKAQGAK